MLIAIFIVLLLILFSINMRLFWAALGIGAFIFWQFLDFAAHQSMGLS